MRLRFRPLLLALIAIPQFAMSQDSKEPATSPTPQIVFDVGFARYVDYSQLGKSWSRLDAATLTDVGLQLAEGERILLRNHPSITSAQVLDMAGRVAVEKNDTATLQRLLTAATNRGDKANEVKYKTLVGSLSANSRAADDETYTSSQLQKGSLPAFENLLHQILVAKLAGDKESLTDIKKGSELLESLTPAQRKKLEGKIDEAGKDSVPNAAVEALRKLSGAVRGDGDRTYTLGIAQSNPPQGQPQYPQQYPPQQYPPQQYPPQQYPPQQYPPQYPQQYPPQGQPRVAVQVIPPSSQKAFSCSGMRYAASYNGAYVQSHGQLGNIVFEPGDVIYNIAGISVNGGTSIDAAVNSAYLSGNRVVTVRDVNTGNVVQLYF